MADAITHVGMVLGEDLVDRRKGTEVAVVRSLVSGDNDVVLPLDGFMDGELIPPNIFQED